LTHSAARIANNVVRFIESKDFLQHYLSIGLYNIDWTENLLSFAKLMSTILWVTPRERCETVPVFRIQPKRFLKTSFSYGFAELLGIAVLFNFILTYTHPLRQLFPNPIEVSVAPNHRRTHFDL
jgi:hypothetical protein